MTERGDSPFRFCFTLDAEPDNLWEYRTECTFDNFKRLPGFHKRMAGAGARLSYLTTSEVVEFTIGRSAMEYCLAAGACEVGAHFHTWTRRWPFPVADLGAPPAKAMAHRLDGGLEADMLAYTCEAIFKAFGFTPTSFRGGRWSFGKNTLRAMHQCGIEVDSTVTPGISWRDNSDGLTDGPDFSHAPMLPHYLVSDDPTLKPVTELPIGTAVLHKYLRKLSKTHWIHDRLERIGERIDRNRLVSGLFDWMQNGIGRQTGYHWLRPTDTSVADMRAVMQALKRQKCPVWVFVIHTSELIPCHHMPTEKHVDRFIERCLQGVQTALELGARPATLTEAARWAADCKLLEAVPSKIYLPILPGHDPYLEYGLRSRSDLTTCIQLF